MDAASFRDQRGFLGDGAGDCEERRDAPEGTCRHSSDSCRWRHISCADGKAAGFSVKATKHEDRQAHSNRAMRPHAFDVVQKAVSGCVGEC